ncbi:hypothetical protein N7510_008560 [Penicillium lagena]|uniref:uncharacterized protein n=1 Tax=Penicillium lagena TaxID=94218 RepID=UPI002542672F|nr:uncharacterized protein N7510_008560 [Penicillium lagena]KAJ5605779.1 hypothetical protein N7510_008560 [Penicillium lagena]
MRATRQSDRESGGNGVWPDAEQAEHKSRWRGSKVRRAWGATGVPGAETTQDVTYGRYVCNSFPTLVSPYMGVSDTQHDCSSLARPSVGSLPISHRLGNA